MLDQDDLGAVARIVTAFLTIGVVGSVNRWIIGPSKGMFAAGEQGNIPAFFRNRNRYGVPVRILLVTAIPLVMYQLSKNAK